MVALKRLKKRAECPDYARHDELLGKDPGVLGETFSNCVIEGAKSSATVTAAAQPNLEKARPAVDGFVDFPGLA